MCLWQIEKSSLKVKARSLCMELYQVRVFRSIIFIMISGLLLGQFGCSHWQPRSAVRADQQAESAILFIGDGLGVSQLTATRIWAHGSAGRLNMESMPFTGYVSTYAEDHFVTDSAAAATALASGVKTDYRRIGVSSEKTGGRPLVSIVDIARDQGKSIGIVTTTRVTHATPAAFYAQTPSRAQELEIAEQFVSGAKVDLLLGGGRRFFTPPEWQDPEESKVGERTDGRNLIDELVKKGWTYVDSSRGLESFMARNPTPKDSKLIGLFEYDHMRYELDRQNDKLGEPSLAEMVDAAIGFLSRNPNGFFLMVEAGRIDHAGHGNMAHHMLGDTLAMDEAVKRARQKIQSQDLSTLLVVTSDHETGGLAINGYALREQAERQGLLGNVQGKAIMTFSTGPGGGKGDHSVDLDKGPERVHPALYRLDSAVHTAVDVPVLAEGPGAHRFTGFMDNTDIPHKILKSMGLPKLPKQSQ